MPSSNLPCGWKVASVARRPAKIEFRIRLSTSRDASQSFSTAPKNFPSHLRKRQEHVLGGPVVPQGVTQHCELSRTQVDFGVHDGPRFGNVVVHDVGSFQVENCVSQPRQTTSELHIRGAKGEALCIPMAGFKDCARVDRSSVGY